MLVGIEPLDAKRGSSILLQQYLARLSGAALLDDAGIHFAREGKGLALGELDGKEPLLVTRARQSGVPPLRVPLDG